MGCKIHLRKSCSRENDFSSQFRCRGAADNNFPACVTCGRQLRMRTMINQRNPYSSSISFLHLKLFKMTTARWQRVNHSKMEFRNICDKIIDSMNEK